MKKAAGERGKREGTISQLSQPFIFESGEAYLICMKYFLSYAFGTTLSQLQRKTSISTPQLLRGTASSLRKTSSFLPHCACA
jgi:hypothetical protein